MASTGFALSRLYADRQPLRARQLLADVALLVWCVFWVRLADRIGDGVRALAGPAEEVERAGAGLRQRLEDAGGRVEDVPLLGDSLAEPLRAAARAGGGLAGAGRNGQDVVDDLALWLSLPVLVLPVLWAIWRWLPWRLRWVREAAAARSLQGAPGGDAVLAARAVASQPLTALAVLPRGDLKGWRRGDPVATARLARLELAALGLRGTFDEDSAVLDASHEAHA